MELEGFLHFWSETGTEGGYWAFQDKKHITPNTTEFSCSKCGLYWYKKQDEILDKVLKRWEDIYFHKVRNRLITEGISLEPDDLSSIRNMAVQLVMFAYCSEKEHDWQPTTPIHWGYEGLHVLEDGDVLTVFEKDDPSKIIWQGKLEFLHYPPFSMHTNGMWQHTDPYHILRGKVTLLRLVLIPLLKIVSRWEWDFKYQGNEQNNKGWIESGQDMEKCKLFISSLINRLTKKRKKEWAHWFFEEYPAKLRKKNIPHKNP